MKTLETTSNRIKSSNGGQEQVTITAPNFNVAVFEIRGISPLVIHRFSKKVSDGLLRNMTEGKSASSKKKREKLNEEDTFNEARYISKEGWDGFHAGSIRKGVISACRLVNFKMTLAKLSIFVIPDGWDAQEPQIPLIRIYGKPVMQKDVARVANGNPYICIRAAYHEWSAKPRIRWDADQFTSTDVANLLNRLGRQVGIGEGRHDSKESSGMGWGEFEIVS